MENRLRISNWMKHDVISVLPDTTVREAAILIIEKRIGTLPVVNEEGELVGVASINDIIEVFLPDFVSLLLNIDFVKDYGALNSTAYARLEKAKKLAVADMMHEAVTVQSDSSLIRALSVMHKHQLQDLIVVKGGKLVGIASRVDIGRAFLTSWLKSKDV